MWFLTERKLTPGFTLIEIMMAVAIVGILATVVTFNVRDSGTQSRDAQRQADLRNLQIAIEAYKQERGRYPAGCNSVGNWSGQLNTDYVCTDGSRDYIRDHANSNISLAPKYIRTLPIDKKLNGTNSGYVYRTNADGTVYKIMAMRTVESERLNDVSDYQHPFKSCDFRVRQNADGSFSELAAESWCNRSSRPLAGAGAANATIPHCRHTDDRFQTSYGLWGGFAPCTGNPLCSVASGANANTVEAWTEIVICQ